MEVNPILNDGEWGFEADNNRVKIGNGVTAWNDLDYFHKTEADVRASILPLPLEPNSTTVTKSDGSAVLSESSGIAVLDNVTLGSNVIGAGGGGGGSANTLYYDLLSEEWHYSQFIYSRTLGYVTIDNSQHYLIGNATFTIQNNI